MSTGLRVTLAVAALFWLSVSALAGAPGGQGTGSTNKQVWWRITLQASPLPKGGAMDNAMMETITGILRARLDSLGVDQPSITRAGKDKLIVAFRGDEDPTEAQQYLVDPGSLEFISIPGLRSERHSNNYEYGWKSERDAKGRETVVLLDHRKGDAVVDQAEFFADPSNYQVIVSGSQLKTQSIQATYASATGQAIVSLAFDKEGAKAFSDYTQTHIGDVLCIVIDKSIISAPSIRTHIADGSGQIEGGFKDLRDALMLATLLKAGALPAKLSVIGCSKSQLAPGTSTRAAQIILIVLVVGAIVAWLVGRAANKPPTSQNAPTAGLGP